MSGRAGSGTPTRFGDATDRASAAQQFASAADDLVAYITGHRRSLTDWILVSLTWLAVATNVLLLLLRHRHGWLDTVRAVDAVVAGLLFLSICWRWLRFRIGWIYLGKRLWEIPALFPLTVPVVSEWRWVLWAVLICRITRATDRTDNVYGDKITGAIVRHFSAPIVDAIKRPITVAVLDEVIDVLQAGTYAENVKAALDENHDELEAMILDLVRQDPVTRKLRYLPFHDDVVQLMSGTVLRIVDGALADPRTTELISDVIRNSATQLRHAVRGKS